MNILITGGGSGLGSAIVEEFAGSANNTVYFTYFSSSDKANELKSRFPNTHAIKCDFQSKQDMARLTQDMLTMNLDVLVNNAMARMEEMHFHKKPLESFVEGFSCNILPVIQITQQALTIFRQKKFGRIVTVLSSYLINRPPSGLSEYVAEKAYLQSLSKSWAVENAAFNVTANCISPSFMLTGLTSDTDARVLEQIISKQPQKQLLSTGEVAKMISTLTQFSSHLNGMNLIVNGASDLV